MIRIALLTTAIALGITATQADAWSGPRGERPDFSEIDTDGDGQISEDEIAVWREEAASRRFASIDTDGDGALSPEELDGMRGARAAARMMEGFDTDGDGSITAEEIRAEMERRSDGRQQQRFARADADGDGLITQEEFEQAMESRRGAHRGMFGGRGHDGPRHN